MNWNIIEGKWKESMGSAREKWGMLTSDDLKEIEGKKEKLEGMLQVKYGLTQEAAAKQIDDWADSLKETIKL